MTHRMINASRKVRLKDVAKRAELSVAAVSMALANHPDISSETKHRVQSISRAIGYRRKTSHGSVAESETSTLRFGLLMIGGNWNDVVAAEMVQAFSIHCHKSGGVRTEIASIESIVDAQETRRRTLELAAGVDGLVLTGIVDPTLLAALDEQSTPFIIHGDLLADPESVVPTRAHIVASDDLHMGLIATGWLIAKGHLRIGFVCERTPVGMVHWRWRSGYRLAHSEHRLPLDPSLEYVTGVILAGEDAAAEHFTKLSTPPTALIAPDARIARMVLHEMQLRGITYKPQDVVIYASDGIADLFGMNRYPRLRINTDDAAQFCVRRLFELRQTPFPAGTKTTLPFQLRNFS